MCAFVCVFGCALVSPTRAWAHDTGLSRGEYAVEGRAVSATLTFARKDVGPSDADALASAVVVRGDGAPCVTRTVAAEAFESDATRLRLEATCAAPPRAVEVEAAFLASLPFGHRHLVHVLGPDAPADVALTVGRRTFSFGGARPAPRALGFVAMGLEHIVTGVDHLVFVLGLVVVAARLRALLVVITAFTLGHSVSLAAATWGVVVASPRLVEPAIALSIAWVGVENLRWLRRGDAPRRRAWLTFGFGLVHGLGFASALREVALPHAELPRALLAFNVGVELGQVLALLPLLGVLAWARRRPAFAARGPYALSAAVAAAGAAWFVARVVG